MPQTETYKATPEIPVGNLQNGVRVIQAFCRDSYSDANLCPGMISSAEFLL